jgi:hypothetical protein
MDPWKQSTQAEPSPIHWQTNSARGQQQQGKTQQAVWHRENEKSQQLNNESLKHHFMPRAWPATASGNTEHDPHAILRRVDAIQLQQESSKYCSSSAQQNRRDHVGEPSKNRHQ